MKKIARYTIYNILGRIDALLGRQNSIVVYCYHNISHNPWVFHVAPATFRKQMEYLSSVGNFVSEEDIHSYLQGKITLPKKSFAITFDDGYRGIKKVLPITKHLGISPTVFVMGSGSEVDRSEIDTQSQLLTNSELKTLVGEKWNIGSHGLTHKKLTKLPKALIKKEISKSKKLIENVIGKPVSSFAYPHGKYNVDAVSEVKNNGYKLAFSVDDDLITNKTSPFVIPRVGVMGDHTDSEFRYLASPSVLAFRRAVKKTFLSKYI